jgi:diguanylate cyclase (GGDEF)-like protein
LISPGLFEPSSFNAFVNGAQTVAGLLILVGFVLLASERVRHDFEMLAARDSLTGALMRRAWNAAAQAEIERSVRHQRSVSLIAMDLDHFKHINDSLGHAAGDQVLVCFVNTVGQHLRAHDLLGRIGGEEFVLLLPETALEEAVLVAERIRMKTETLQIPCAFTVSMGVSQLASGNDSLESLLKRADVAMYRAKAHGRNQVERETIAGEVTRLVPQEPPIKSALRRA